MDNLLQFFTFYSKIKCNNTLLSNYVSLLDKVESMHLLVVGHVRKALFHDCEGYQVCGLMDVGSLNYTASTKELPHSPKMPNIVHNEHSTEQH